jgi:hypothetical protein
MHAHDREQYQLMEAYLVKFESGKSGLHELIENLYGVINGLQATEQEWKDAFQSEWWNLEQVYAVAVDREQKVLDTESQNLVYETIKNMKSLLKTLIKPIQS